MFQVKANYQFDSEDRNSPKNLDRYDPVSELRSDFHIYKMAFIRRFYASKYILLYCNTTLVQSVCVSQKYWRMK